MILAIDFDGVIHDWKRPVEGRKMGEPLPGAFDALSQFKEKGMTVVIHTTKATSAGGQQAVQDWLKFYQIPYDVVTAIKPQADFYIDDRAIRHADWPSTIEKLRSAV